MISPSLGQLVHAFQPINPDPFQLDYTSEEQRKNRGWYHYVRERDYTRVSPTRWMNYGIVGSNCSAPRPNLLFIYFFAPSVPLNAACICIVQVCSVKMC
ncbi:hypothetical protein GYMLUDRAFT_285871 [Collybiopsis luxurians FD-317 M1]|nr:hypothetical protein GYMLUDRAFT_285871 [Collybiopsis luxurians FD-317 M1]